MTKFISTELVRFMSQIQGQSQNLTLNQNQGQNLILNSGFSTLYCSCFKQIDGCFLDRLPADIGHFADFEQVKNSHFSGFGQSLSKSENGSFADSGEVKKNKQSYNKTPVGETGCLRTFGLLPRATGTPSWLVRPVKVSTSSELYPDTRLFFFI